MSLIFLDWKTPDEEEDSLWDLRCCNNQDICGVTEEEIRRLCKERIIKCVIPIMNFLLMAFVWTVSLNYGSVLMPTVLTIIIVLLYIFNYLEDHAIKHSLSHIIHLKHDNNSNKNEPKVQTLERCDSNSSKINYFNYSQNYYIETIDEHNEDFADQDSPSETRSKRSMTVY